MRILQVTTVIALTILSIQSRAGGYGEGGVMDSAQVSGLGIESYDEGSGGGFVIGPVQAGIIGVGSYAGGTSGNGLLELAQKLRQRDRAPEAVLHLETNDNTVKFLYGQYVEDDWLIEDVEVGIDDLTYDHPALRAIEESEDFGSWAEIE